MSDQQRTLFDVAPEPWENDDQARQLVATVVLQSGPAGEFDYLLPDELREQAEAGCRVKVPFGPADKLRIGYVVRLEERPLKRRLKAVHTLLDPYPLLRPQMLRLTQWLAERYLCDWSAVLKAVVPAGVRSGAGTRLTTVLYLDEAARKRAFEADLPPKQREVLRILAASAKPLTPGELARAARCTQGPIAALRRKGLIRAKTGRIDTLRPEEKPPVAQRPLLLNPEQEQALNAIRTALHSSRHSTILIHGVTGSGKTEVYIQAIAEVLQFGRQAIVLVPEISLTPQTVERFRRRFGAVAVLHSHLSDAERHWHWRRIAAGEVSVVVGARSAVFAPTPHLGLIVMDEEHEASFKQESAPRYHAREVALARAAAENIPLVLGSATPSLESWHRAQTGRYVLVEMPRRVLDRPLPAVGTIDLRARNRRSHAGGGLSRQLRAAISEALAEGGQVMLLLNRRGYSTHIQCPACGHVVLCPHCDIALTHHRTQQIALCHYCNYETQPPVQCPKCSFEGIRYAGLGTQRLEAEVRAAFPDVLALRMDTDAMQAHGSHARALEAFRSGKVRILLGTQMIAKGLDFPEVTLVGIVNADTALHLPDFRAAERTFQLVTQAAGRTGRGPKGGRVLVQTFSPEHPAIRASVRHDYAAFAAYELPLRKMLLYPPFSEMIRLVVRGRKEPLVAGFAEQLGRRLGETMAQLKLEARLLGPAPCPFAKLRGKYRYHLQLQGPDGAALRQAIRQATTDLEPPEDVHWIADVDPMDMM